jgi:hypothetical protein
VSGNQFHHNIQITLSCEKPVENDPFVTEGTNEYENHYTAFYRIRGLWENSVPTMANPEERE